MREQNTTKAAITKTRISKASQEPAVVRLVPPTAEALREAHMNLVRAEQNLYNVIQANPQGGALFGSQLGFGQPAAYGAQAPYASQQGYETLGFNAGYGHPAAFQGFHGIGNGMAPSISSLATSPSASAAPWAPWTAGLPAAPVSVPLPSWSGRGFAPVGQGQGSIGRALACDVIDEGEQLVCQFELPGVGAEQVEVLCFGSALTVSAYREAEGEILNLVQSERATATQQRIIRLPSQVQPSGATATLTNGVLTIVLPKLHPTEGPRLVAIKS